MKVKYIYVFISFIFLLATVSCGDSGGGVENRTSMFALVGSTNWRTPNPNAIISENTIDVWGTSANGQSIHISLKSGETGEFQLGHMQDHEAKFTINMSPGTLPYSTSTNENGTGLVRVTSINEEARTISGTFHFTGYRASDGSSRRVSDGQFNSVPYRFIHSSDTTSYNSTFACQDEGNQWVAQKIHAIKNDTAIIIKAEISDIWESIEMIFPPEITAGVHYITSTGPIFANFQKGFHTYPATNGSTTIIQHSQSDRVIRGSFFFNYIDNDNHTGSVTSGQFDVEYELEE